MKFLPLVFLLLVGCDMRPKVVPTPPDEAKQLVNSFQYTKADNGLCFGVTTTKRMSSNATVAINVIVVHVPCDAVKL